MCMITVKPKGVPVPSDDCILNGENTNRDGIGVAWKRSNEPINLKKDFVNARTLLAWIKETITQDDILIIHYRNATTGLEDEGNRHPFPITKDEKEIRMVNGTYANIMAHNGVISEFNKAGKSIFSDTQLFIMNVMAEPMVINNIEHPLMQKFIQEFIGSWNKLAILRENGQLILFGDYIKHRGCFYSNKGYEGYEVYGRGFYQRKTENTSVTSHFHKKEESIPLLQQKDKDGVFRGMCDGDCNINTYTFVKEYEFPDGRKKNFCKLCRKKAKKDPNYLKPIETRKCNTCFTETLPSMGIVIGDTFTCNDCYGQIYARG